MKACCFKKWCEFFTNKKPIVKVIAIDGVIGGVGYKQGLTIKKLNPTLEKAFKDKNTKAVALSINSPGGSPVQSELIAKRIMQLSIEKQIPVLSFIEDMAASGGYWIACAGSEIITAENSILGSLGVIFSGFGFQEAINKLGVERRVHTKGSNKAIMDPFLPEKQEDIDTITKVQEDIYNNFKNHVMSARKDKLKLSEEEAFSGKIWSGTHSVELGFADKVGDLYSEIKFRFGDDVLITIVNQEKSWLRSKLNLFFEVLFEKLEQNFVLHKKFELR